MNISLKELKILIDSHDYIEFIFLYKKTNNKDSYQLMIEIPIPNRQGRREKTGSCRRKKHHYTLSTKENHLSITKDLIQIAEDKGWESIKVKGTKEFKKDVWLEAKLRGIEVKGYKPNEQDLRKLSSESEKRGINIIEEDNKDKDPAPALKFENSKITELKEAMASLPKHEAIEKFPELKKVYAVEPSAIAFYKSQKGLPKDQLNEFVEKATDRAITELAQGQEIPDFDAKEIKGSKTKTSTKKEIDFD